MVDGQLINEARRHRRLPHAVIAPVLREGDLGALARARQPHMGQPPLFFEARPSGLIEAALMGQEPFVPAGQEHGVEFQPLGRMKRHQVDPVGAFFGRRVHDERDMLHEARERVELLHEADQLLQVLQAPLRLLGAVRLPHGGVAGFIEDQLGELRVAHRVDERAPAVEGRKEIGKRLARLRPQFLGLDDQPGCLRQGNAVCSGELVQRLQRGVAQAPAWRIDDALELQIVRRVQRHFKIGRRVADFLALVEARAADHAVVEAERDKAVLEGAHLEGRAHENGELVERMTVALQLLDVLADDAGLFLVVPAALDHDLLAFVAFGVQRLAEPPLVVGDEAGGSREDMTRRAVIAFEPDHLGAGEVGLEAQDVVHLRAAPAIDGLVVVTDAANITGALRQEAQPQILRDVGVLILVHQHVGEAILEFLKHVRVLLEQPQVLQQEIAKVGGVQLFEPALIERVEIAPLTVGETESFAVRHAGRCEPAVLPAVDHGGEQSRRPTFLVDILRREQLLEQPDLIVGIEHREGRLEIDQLRVSTQNLHPNGVERPQPRHAFDHAAYQFGDPCLHLARRPVGEGHREDLAGPGAALAQDVADSRRQDARFAGPRAGQHQEGAVEALDGVALFRIQRLQIVGGAPPHGALGQGQGCRLVRLALALGVLGEGGRLGGGCANLGHEPEL